MKIIMQLCLELGIIASAGKGAKICVSNPGAMFSLRLLGAGPSKHPGIQQSHLTWEGLVLFKPKRGIQHIYASEKLAGYFHNN